jgi:uncharacterized protein (DUF608 family)
MHREDKARSGITLGGIGSGGAELRKDGIFRNWNAFNNAPLGTGPLLPWEQSNLLFFIVRYQIKGQAPKMKILQIDEGHYVARVPNHIYEFPWLTGVARIDYQASYPFARLRFSDPEMPLTIDLTAWHPFIPYDAANSALPGFYCDFTVTATTNQPVDVLLTAAWRGCIGYDVEDKTHRTQTSRREGALTATMHADGMDPAHTSFGTQTLLSAGSESTYYTGWEHRHPYYEIFLRSAKLPDIDDTDGRNPVDKQTGKARGMDRIYSTVGRHRRLTRKGQGFAHTFVIAWHFPNLYAGLTERAKQEGRKQEKVFEGHYYANFLEDADAAARYLFRNRKKFLERSLAFHEHFFDSSLPRFVLEQINSQLNTFTTSTWFTKEGDFGVQEGMLPERRVGPIATIDVGLYGSIAAAALFPQLDHAMMRAHKRIQRPNGEISHSVPCNFHIFETTEHVHSRLDLPSQFVIMTIRGYFFTGDRHYLKEMWPAIVKALRYVHTERDKDGDGLPDMEGAMCTYDNFPMFGPASYVAGLWLSALTHAIEAAKILGAKEEAADFADWLEHGRKVFEEKLWNGEYFILYNDEGGSLRGDRDEGCLSDQIIGQFTNHQCGLGPIVPEAKARRALRAVMKRNYRDDLGLANCQWPGDVFFHEVDPDCWNDQANTVWTGVELAFAAFLLYEGMERDALKVIANVDERYRRQGRYFDHQEFGGHYYRPMSAWSILHGALGLAMREYAYTFAPSVGADPLRLFFTHGAGMAHYERKRTKNGETITVEVHTGTLKVRSLELALAEAKAVAGSVAVRAAGKTIARGKSTLDTATKGRLGLDLGAITAIPAGKTLRVNVQYT